MVLAAGAFALAVSHRVKGDPAEVASAYFAAWRRGDVEAMARLVYQPPPDFVTRHRSLTEELHVQDVKLEPGAVRSTGEESAEVPFTGSRVLREFGPWPFASTLRLAVRDRAWKVIWTPETLHPLLKDGGTLELTSFEGLPPELVTSEGAKIPNDSYAESYLARLRPELGEGGEGVALVSVVPGQQARRLMAVEPERKAERTTLSQSVQAAAARALDGVADAAVVALRPSTGEILAVADRLRDNRSALRDFFPPGSTFKTITAAALLESGLDPAAQLDCPGSYTIPGNRSIRNAGGQGHGTVSFADAYAYSCNTTFVQQAVTRLRGSDLVAEAQKWGFTGANLSTGVGGKCGRMNPPGSVDEFAADSFGQGTVEATPLCMAMVAAAVQNGSWRAPRILPLEAARRIDGAQANAVVKLDDGVVAALREMMRAVVDHGTAGQAGLPDGVSGKTGTAEAGGGAEHGWFIGYRDDLAFCVFVRNGGSGRSAALPIAARFLNGL
ncbi:penicillin-binding transpeptidase domain-containing protein [Nonomuraea sp. NPDC000554]|uniref:penicillin-binding transpeptidase domain-containing protein n=1 Tax=Nonomuraea sp. NPDC000554 TaxID=3154259 RepID=UPI0033271370